MLGNFLAPQLPAQQDIWFQQDGATTHIAKVNMDSLCTVFGNHNLSWFTLIQWLPRLPSLSALDFFLLGYLNDRFYCM
jgi:hypothetical protein